MKNILTILFLFICVAANAQLIKFSELPSASTLGGTEIVPAVQSGDNRKISLNQIKTFVWDLSPTIATNDTIGFVIVRRTSDGKIFKRSVSSILGGQFWPLTGSANLTGNVTIDGDGTRDLNIHSLNSFNLESTGAISFITALGGDLEIGSSGLYTASGSNVFFSATALGTGDVVFGANDDINLNANDDLLLNGASGTTNQVITNTDGHASWGNLSTIGATVFWPLVGGTPTLGGNFVMDGNSNDLEYNNLGEFSAVSGSGENVTIESAHPTPGSSSRIRLNADEGVTQILGIDVLMDAVDELQFRGTSITLGDGTAGPGNFRFLEDSDNGNNYIGWVAPATLASDQEYTWPSSFPASNGYVLSSTTTGTLSWTEAGGADGGYATIEDEGSAVTQRTTIDFQGAGVSVADVGGETVVTIPGGGGSAYNTIEDEGVAETQRTTLNFAGSGVSVADVGGETVVTIPGAGGGGANWPGDNIFDVKDYGADPSDASSDLAAFQAAWDDAAAIKNGKVIIPAPDEGDFYILDDTWEWLPAAGESQVWVNVEMMGGEAYSIHYTGPDDQPVIRAAGLKSSIVIGLKIQIDAGISGVQVMQIITSSTYPSSTGCTFTNFRFSLGDGIDNIGIQTNDGAHNGDISHYEFQNIAVYGGGDPFGASIAGQYAFLNVGTNTLAMSWKGGFVAECDRIYSNKNRAGTFRGNGSVSFMGMGGSNNNIDYQFAWEQTYFITGGRYENGNKHILVTDGGYLQIVMTGYVVKGYDATADIIELQRACGLSMNGVQINNNDTGHTYNPIIKLNASTSNRNGLITITNCGFQIPVGTNIPYTQTGNTVWTATIYNTSRMEGVNTIGPLLNLENVPVNAGMTFNTITVGNVTTGEDQLDSYTIPANTMNADGSYIAGTFSGTVANNANVKTFRLKFGSTTIATRTTTTPTIGQGWKITFECIRTGASAQKCNVDFSGSDGVASAYYVATTEAHSGTIAVVLTGEGTATNDIVKQTRNFQIR